MVVLQLADTYVMPWPLIATGVGKSVGDARHLNEAWWVICTV